MTFRVSVIAMALTCAAALPAKLVSSLGEVSTLRKSGPKASRKKPDPKGANAVVNITTHYRDEVTSNAVSYRCERGMQLVSVHMIGQAAIVE